MVNLGEVLLFNDTGNNLPIKILTDEHSSDVLWVVTVRIVGHRGFRAEPRRLSFISVHSCSTV
uniref:Uncharacterized protein n=1 Tax=Anguilla anguilla TaxID=7936 RepID=A0A0E9R5W1_ANGAN